MAFNKARALQEAEKLVAQGKISLAIKQYEDIVQRDRSDLNLLNTIGDLYVRERNAPKALEQFHKLADSYLEEGFTVKAIAMYKKISKLDVGAVEPVLKLAELYQQQGLAREAREQYAFAVDFYKKSNQNDKALGILHTIVRIDPDNAAVRLHLGEFCEAIGQKAEAVRSYVEAAEMALRRKDIAGAEAVVKRAAALDSSNSKVHLVEAQVALSRQQPARAEKIITSDSALKGSPEGRRLLLEAYLAAHKLASAQDLVSDVYRANPTDFSPLASFTALCIEKADYSAAVKPLAAAADGLVEQKNTGPLMECLRRLWEKAPQNVPLLELIYDVTERTGDTIIIPEVLEGLGHAYVQANDLAKAEVTYRKLIEHEPENEGLRGMLKQVLQKQGKDVVVAPDLANVEMAPATEPVIVTSTSVPASADSEEAVLVKEAIENSDLYYRYGSVDKAMAELEKVLAEYPEQTQIHKRVIEVCQRSNPARAVQAEQALVRIYSQGGETAKAKKYEDMARQDSARAAEQPAPKPSRVEIEAPTAPAKSPDPALQTAQAKESTSGPESSAPEPEASGATASLQGVPQSEAAPSVSQAPPPAGKAHEVDLSEDLEAMMSGAPKKAAKTEPEVPAFRYEESKVEIDFYLENGFIDEARTTVESLEKKFPGNAQVAELRQLVEGRAATTEVRVAEPVAVPETPAKPVEAPEPVKVEVAAKANENEPSVVPPAPAEAQEPPLVVEVPHSRPPTAEELPIPVASTVADTGGETGDLLGSLASEFAATLEGIETSASPPPLSSVSSPPATTASVTWGGVRDPASPLSGLLEELGEPAEEQPTESDLETHYSLGVAFREMGLLDEAIGEFQKVVRGTKRDRLPPNYLQVCTLLGLCFMEQKMPAVAAKWYARALEVPGLDEGATLALQYDLGNACEQAGDTRTALEKFTEVYSQNIDFRDVAEKIRLLQQKAH